MADPSEPIRFRTTKKRKAYRQRPTPDDDITPTPPPAEPIDSHDEDEEDEDPDADAIGEIPAQGQAQGQHSAAAAALRLRTSHRAGRLRGMGFKSEARNRDRDEAQSQALVPREAELQLPAQLVDAGGVDGRFMHQTGLLTILDDVHIRNASHTDPNPPLSNNKDHRDPTDDPVPETQASPSSSTAISGRAKDHQQPARHGKLFEVAIPEDVRKQDPNNKRRRTDNNNNNRRANPARTTDDIHRDAMVDQFLHENKLDVYDHVPEASTSSSASTSRYAPGKDFSADARLADQFRRQYYEDLALRRKKRRPALSKKEQQQQRAAQASEVLKGPKLGGSRNQRAAIRNILLQQQGEKKA